ncbi:hypothetical protein DFH27DRAFT_545016 [Peziza echinospora]|nr:hypothetical protein DFH27DRAFT_545016 [Peziza echinospora]
MRSKTITNLLPLLILLTLATPVTAKFNRPEHEVPESLPEFKWEGISNVNHTVLHEEYFDVLICNEDPRVLGLARYCHLGHHRLTRSVLKGRRLKKTGRYPGKAQHPRPSL